MHWAKNMAIFSLLPKVGGTFCNRKNFDKFISKKNVTE